MKVWELKEGMDYFVIVDKSFNKTNSELFTVNMGELCKYNGKKVKIDYNTVKDYDFIEIPIDWALIENKTEILVKNRIEDKWIRIAFYKYSNGDVYAYVKNPTGFDDSRVISYKFAKLLRRN